MTPLRARCSALALPFVAAGTPIVGLLVHGALPYVLLIGAALAIVADPRTLSRGAAAVPATAAVGAAFLLVGTLRAPFSVEGANATLIVTFQALLYGAFLALNGAPLPRQATCRALAAGLALVLGAYLIERAIGFPASQAYSARLGETFAPSAYNRPLTTSLMLACALVLCAPLSIGVRLGLVVAAVVAVFSGDGAAGMAAIGLGAVAFGLALAAERRGVIAIGLVLGLAMISAPFVAVELPVDDARWMSRWPPDNAQSRLHIWRYTGARVRERPWLGWGPDAAEHFAHLPKITRPLFRNGEPSDWTTRPIPSHPHNASLELWLDYGALGVTFGLAFLGLSCRAAQRAVSATDRAVTLALIAIAFTVLNTAYGLWQMDSLTAVAVAALFARRFADDTPPSSAR